VKPGMKTDRQRVRKSILGGGRIIEFESNQSN
jgi:hypothetical protein